MDQDLDAPSTHGLAAPTDDTADDTARAAASVARDLLGIERADVALVLGSGWSSGADRLGRAIARMPLERIPGFTSPVVAGHGGDLLAVELSSGRIAAVFTGRTHLYEGRGVAAVVHGVRTAAALGASVLVLTNGCGGLNPGWAPGTPVLIRDHINLTGETPLRGPVFIDMSATYSPRLRGLAHEVSPDLPEGVYVQFHGPQYETPAEVRMAGILGGDLVGMSTALEAIAARAAGMEVLGISLVTNAAAGITGEPLSHAEVIESGRAAAPRLAELLAGVAARL